MLSAGSCLAPTVGMVPAVFAGAIQYFAAAQCLLSETWPPSANVSDGDEYDFIVVGAGAAGAVVASRLSEINNWNVLLVEAGDDPPIESTIPALHPTLLKTRYDWNTPTVNNSFSGQALKKFSISRGKVLGGGSAINFMMYVRGNRADYDAWENAGNKNWSWDSVLPYFKKSENTFDPILEKEHDFNKYHGSKGTGIRITRAQNYDDEFDRFLKIFNETGFDILSENNGANQLGFSYTYFSIHNGVRESTAHRYLLPNKNRKNLHILKNTMVTKVLLDIKTKTARGVEVIYKNKCIKLFAKKETILSGGAIGSPEILLNSGIGPQKNFHDTKIHQIAELPVGENFQDHVFVPLVITGGPHEVNIKELQFSAIQYLYNKTGILGSGPVPLINGFIAVTEGKSVPDIQGGAFHFEANNTGLMNICSQTFQYGEEVCDSLQDINQKTEVLFIAVVLLHPKSRGKITLGDKCELIVDPNYLSNEEDVLTLKKGIQRLLPLINAKSFQEASPTIGKLNVKQCNTGFQFNSDAYWDCYVRNMVSTLFHPIGSCSMGKVVDAELKVLGVSKLRVADASVMPTMVSGNTCAPAIMIGEKAADMIKNSYA